MMPTIAPPSVLSAPQRRCHILLTLFQPGLVTTTETLSKLNGVDVEIVSKDLNETSREIAGYHQLTIKTAQNGGFRIEGTELNQRLCLLHWLRRGLRLCPAFINEQFIPALKNALKQCGIERTLYDDTNLRALINLCARRLNMQFGDRDMQFLQLFWQYCLLNHHAGQTPDFTPLQQQWMQSCAAWPFALELSRFLHRRAMRNVPREESLFIALLFTLLRVPDPRRDNHPWDWQMRNAISRLVLIFRQKGNVQFRDEQGLHDQLYVHLAQALHRSLFSIGIDNTLPDGFCHLYPRLMRTTQEALTEFANEYDLQFSEEETGLVAVIFGAWLMQENDLHEKQILMLTDNDTEREACIEQQLRELTLLPLNIRHMPVKNFLVQGAPRNVALIVTPYTTTLPLFSPPLIYADQTLTPHQQQQIRKIVESG